MDGTLPSLVIVTGDRLMAEACPSCGGEGNYPGDPLNDFIDADEERDCDECGGTGIVPDAEEGQRGGA